MQPPSSFSRRVGRVLAFILGLLGVFLVVDSLGVFITLVIVSITGGQLSPYTGIVLFLIVPICTAIGCGMCWMSYVWLATRPAGDGVVLGQG